MVLIAVMVSAAAFTYKTKHEAEDELAAVRKLQSEIRFEEDTTALLKADWSLLTQPSRLQKLTELYQAELVLVPVEARQFVGLEDVPVKPVEIRGMSPQQIGGMRDSGAESDQTMTGGVVK